MPPSRVDSYAVADASATAAQVRLLGDPVLLLRSGVRSLERRAAGLLALVALEPGVTRARAAVLLWPNCDDPRRALRQQLSRFKKNYGVELVVGDDALHLAGNVATDLTQEGEPGQTIAALLADLRFDECEAFDVWLQQQRARRRQQATRDLGEKLAAAEAQGDLDAATRLAEQLLLADNDSEAHHRTLMRLHYLRGDIAQAQAVYARLVRQLKARFGAQPSAETELLARALRSAQPAARATSASPVSQPVPVTVLRPPRMIGRQRELAALDASWRSGRAALLVGEPGLGKTRLLAEFAAGRRVLTVKGRPGDAGVPYATLSRLLRTVFERTQIELPAPRRTELARLLPELAPSLPLPTDGQRLLLQGAVEAVLAQIHADGSAADGVIVDDLHFADDASVEMLQALVCRSDEGALVGLRWALAQRPGEGSAAAAALRGTLEEAQALEVIALAPLTADEMAELIDSLGLAELDSEQLAPQLTRHTGGNPLYALETLKQGLTSGLLRQGRLPIPVNVGALIERRLKQLSERALALARVAAIAGVDFSIALAEDVMGVRAVELADAWAELEAAQVLRENAFAHDLVHDAVLRSVPAPIARHLHGAVAHQLQAQDGVAARVAAHWLAAGLERQALPALHRAAAQARAGLRRREELGFLLTAARVEEESGDGAAAWSTLMAAQDAAICVGADIPPELEAARERLAVTPMRQAQLAQDRSTVLINAGRFEEAEVLARRAVAAARACGSPRRLVEALSTLASSLAMLGMAQEARQASDEAMSLMRELDDPAPHLFTERGLLLDNLGLPREGVQAHRAALELSQQIGDRSLIVSVLSNLSCSLLDAGRMAAALKTVEQAMALASAHDQGDGTLTSLLSIRCTVLRELGQFDRAQQSIEQARSVLSEHTPAPLRLTEIAQAAVWWHLGQIAHAQRALPDESALSDLPSWVAARRWLIAARCREALDQPAADALTRAMEKAAASDVRVISDIVRLHAASASATLAGLDTIQSIAAEARRDGRDGVALAAACRGARLAAALGLRHLALTLANEARAMLEGEGDPDDAVTPAEIGELEAWLCLVDAYQQAGLEADAVSARECGRARALRLERDHVPPQFRDSFRHRNPVHRALLYPRRQPV